MGGVLLAFLVQLLLGMAFATPLYGLSAGLEDQTAFAVIYRVALVPLFLFSGAFFPITNLPPVMQWLAVATPLWHGVDLTRMLTLGDVDAWPALVHVAYLSRDARGRLVVVGAPADPDAGALMASTGSTTGRPAAPAAAAAAAGPRRGGWCCATTWRTAAARSSSSPASSSRCSTCSRSGSASAR